ncbi:MAG: dihydrolipoyl dehydrogenase, partial [Armatimonadetes bacterium]|nr:dihydrolipoyl dehydrogenase [Armatimonadota bacterium]
SKALIHAAEAIELARQGKTFGVLFGEPQIDWDGIRKFKARAVKQLTSGVETLLKGNGVAMFVGEARFVGERQVEVRAADGSTQVVGGKNVLVATGSQPFVPPIPGIQSANVYTSDEMVDLPGPFESLAIVGAGAIGCEFAYIYSQLDTKVTVLEMLPQAVPTEDPDVAEVLVRALNRAGVTVLTNAKVVAVEDADGRKRVEYERDGGTAVVEADAILMAVGRRAVLDIGLDAAGIETERNGIRVNERLETTARGVYAAGDCIRGIGLAHLSSHEAIAAVENALGEGGHVNYDCVPACIFTHPEIASVGLKERQAREQGRDVVVGKFPFSANSRAGAVREREGFVKLIADAQTGQLLGASIIGPSAAELIHAPSVAIELGATIEDVAETIHAHPTFAEAIHEAALSALGRALHLPPGR